MAQLPSVFGCVDSAFAFVTPEGFQFTPFGKFGPAYIGTSRDLPRIARGVAVFCGIASVLALGLVGAGIWAKVSHDPSRWQVVGYALAAFIPWFVAFFVWAFLTPKFANLIKVAR